VVTWNLWWRLGEWQARAEAIAATLEKVSPDLVCLQEVWQQGEDNQAALLPDRLGMEYAFAPDQTQGDINRAIAVLSRWPLSEIVVRALPVPLGVGEQTVAWRTVVDRLRGTMLFVTTHLLPFAPRSAARIR
jgi:endonuclease/exonuclease/phosphatase family metal-dependent hydrolase